MFFNLTPTTNIAPKGHEGPKKQPRRAQKSAKETTSNNNLKLQLQTTISNLNLKFQRTCLVWFRWTHYVRKWSLQHLIGDVIGRWKACYQTYQDKQASGLFEAISDHLKAIKVKIRPFLLKMDEKKRPISSPNQQNKCITGNWRILQAYQSE